MIRDTKSGSVANWPKIIILDTLGDLILSVASDKLSVLRVVILIKR